MSDFIRIMNFDPTVSLKGLRGVRPIWGNQTLDDNPYLEFVYDGNTIIQVGPFETDNHMQKCLDKLDADVLGTFLFNG